MKVFLVMSRSVSLAIVLVIALVSVHDASAQSDPVFDANGLQPHRDYFSQLPFEHIDPITGSVVLTFTDLVLPGSGGRDLVFQRTYNSKGAFGGAPGSWSFGIAGIPTGVVDSWPLNPETIPYLQMADGSAIAAATPLYPAGDANHRSIMMTDRFWKYYRSSRILWLPDGSVVTFGNPTTLTDAFGNLVLSIAVSGYTQTTTQYLGNGESRQVTVTFPENCSTGCLPTSMTYDGRTWTYTADGVFLRSAQPPDGWAWQYEYGGGSGLQTMKTITPHGGSVEYTIETVGFPWLDGETLFTNVVRYRDTVDVRGGSVVGPLDLRVRLGFVRYGEGQHHHRAGWRSYQTRVRRLAGSGRRQR
jgi:hypothetical protein